MLEIKTHRCTVFEAMVTDRQTGTYGSTGHKDKQEGSDGCTGELGDPVDNALEQRDMASEEQAEGNGRVHMSARHIGGDGDGHKECESVS